MRAARDKASNSRGLHSATSSVPRVLASDDDAPNSGQIDAVNALFVITKKQILGDKNESIRIFNICTAVYLLGF